jgi:hypothetical protein
MIIFFCLRPGGQVPIFISTRNRVAQLYPQALGSFFVTSYDLQGYGGGIRPHHHLVLLHNLGTNHVEVTTSNSFSTVVLSFIAMETCLLPRYQNGLIENTTSSVVYLFVAGDMFTTLFPSNGRLYSCHYSYFQLSSHNMIEENIWFCLLFASYLWHIGCVT